MKVGRESLYKSLNGDSEPKFKTIDKFLRAIGIGIKFAPISTIASIHNWIFDDCSYSKNFLFSLFFRVASEL